MSHMKKNMIKIKLLLYWETEIFLSKYIAFSQMSI